MFGCVRQSGPIILQPRMVLFQMVWLSEDLVLVLDLRTIIMNISRLGLGFNLSRS